jgi:hypothetical protein
LVDGRVGRPTADLVVCDRRRLGVGGRPHGTGDSRSDPTGRDCLCRTDRVAESVERWDTDDVFELVSVDVEGSEVVVSLDGPETPDDVDALAAALEGVFGGAVTLDLRVTIVERTVVGP